MCGINVLQFPTAAKGELDGGQIQAIAEYMAWATQHRGPDKSQALTFTERATGRTTSFAVNRLALRGQGAGEQPCLVPGGMLAYNGELFDLPYESDGDTISLANALAVDDWGFLARHPGMMAFVWQELSHDNLYLARDPFGIKPLYMTMIDGGASIISSEVKGILASGMVKPKLSPESLSEMLAYRCIRGKAGLFDNISPIPPGFVYQIHDGMSRATRHFPPFKADRTVPSVSDIKATLLESLLHNLTSDKPVGLMLSGGIDSGLLACMASEAGVKLPCFTTDGPEYEHAEALAKRLGHPIHKVHVPRGTEDWLEFLHHSPAPIADPGGYMTWCVARAARAEGIPVLLSGAGADEVFLGYRRHAFFHRYRNWINHPYFYLVASAFPAMHGRLPQSLHFLEPQFADRDMIYYRTLMASPGNLAHYLRMAPYAPNWVFKRKQKVALPQGVPQMPDVLWLDLFTYLPDQVLAATDLYSMAHSVEVRVPYLTPKLVSMAWALGPKALLKEGTKTPLRQLFAQYGGTILPKTGFGPTEAQYPDFHEMDTALGLDQPGHPIYQHLPFAKVARWRSKKMGLQARMAFWCAGIQMRGIDK